MHVIEGNDDHDPVNEGDFLTCFMLHFFFVPSAAQNRVPRPKLVFTWSISVINLSDLTDCAGVNKST